MTKHTQRFGEKPLGRPDVIVVAHRGANLTNVDAAPADWPPGDADVVEADVHWFRGRLEVRHSKALWPTSRLYDHGSVLPRSAARPEMSFVVEALPQRSELWVDLKGPDPRLPVAVKNVVADRRPLRVSARCWWQLAPFRGREGTCTFMSVGSRWQRPLARLALALGWSDGIVLHERLATSAFLESTARSAPIVAWAVSSRDRARWLMAHGVAGLIIDSPELMRDVRADIEADRRYRDRTA